MQEDIALSPFSPLPPLPTELPLFPLHTVLFPGGLLPLRIFEARYMDMVRTCLRDQTPFGVCLIERGNEVATAEASTVPVDVGCIAHIVECDMEQLGLLMIKVRGTQRFKVLMAEPYEWNSPSWVANRLCELLPVPLKAKQKLMELMDAGMRIEIVHRYMKQHHIL